MFLLQLSVLYWMNNSLISNIYFPQCLLFSRITHLRRSYICWLDSMRLTSSRETQKILIEMVLTNKTHTHTRARTSVWWKIRLVSMKINDTLFFKTPPIWPAPPFLWEKSEPHPFFCENWENSTLPLFKVNNKNTKLMSLILIWICSKSTIKGPERPQLNHLIPTENILVLLRIPSYVTPELYFLK